jgi:hypothetical protein
MKRLFILFFLLLPLILFAAPTFMGGKAIDTGQFQVNIGSDALYYSNIISILDGGVRYGLAKDWDAGLKFYGIGGMLDFRYQLLNHSPFITSADIEGGMDYKNDQFAGFMGMAVIMDIELAPYFNIYLSGRWRFPAVSTVDSLMITNDVQGGAIFMTRVGVELFRKEVISINIEGGIARIWGTEDLYYNAGLMLNWNI